MKLIKQIALFDALHDIAPPRGCESQQEVTEYLELPDREGRIPAQFRSPVPPRLHSILQANWSEGGRVERARTLEGVHALARAADTVVMPGDGQTFRVLGLGGRGRRCVVYRLADAEGGRYALKVACYDDPQTLASVKLEPHQQYLLDGRGIEFPQLIEAGADYLLRGWSEGMTGDQWLCGRRWPRQQVVALLEYIQSCIDRDVIIADFKPANLVLREDGSWICIDAGRLTVGAGSRAAYRHYRRSLIRKWMKRGQGSWDVLLSDLWVRLRHLLRFV